MNGEDVDHEAETLKEGAADGAGGTGDAELDQAVLGDTEAEAPKEEAAADGDDHAGNVEPEDPVRAAILRGDFETGHSFESILEEITAVPPLKRTEAALQYDILRFAAIMPEPCVCLARLKAGLQTLGVKVRDWNQVVRQLRSQIEQERKLEEQAERETNDPRVRIVTNTLEEFQVNELAAEAIGTLPNLYQRFGELVFVHDSKRRRPGEEDPLVVHEIRAVTEPLLREYFSRAARWFEEGTNEHGEPVLRRSHPPDWSVRAVHDWKMWPAVRPLYFVAEAPVILPDGTIIAFDGYNLEMGILHRPQLSVPWVPEQPTQQEVHEAGEKLLDLVCDFPFETPAHRSAWLAALLTPLTRWAFKNQTPFFMFEANQSGSGKGMLLKVIGWIVLGREMDFVVQTADEEEERKRITAKLRRGETMILIDNIDKPFGSAALDATITTGTWGERLLGTNDAPSLDAWLTWYGSANNPVFKREDTRRRTCTVRLRTDMPRPETRTGYKYADLEAHVLAHRGELYAAALTMIRGWLRSGLTTADLPGWGGPWGSFNSWDQVIRGAIVYAGFEDPIAAKATEGTVEVESDGLRLLLQGMAEAAAEFPDGVTSNAIVEALKENDEWRRADRATSPSWRRDEKTTPLRLVTLRKALTILLPRLRSGEVPNHYQIGNLLARYRDRPISTESGTKRLAFKTVRGIHKWLVESVPTTSPVVEPSSGTAGVSAPCERCGSPLDPACGQCSRCSVAQGGCRCGECLERLGTGEYRQASTCNLCGNATCRCRHCGCCTQLDMMRGGCCC